MSRKNMDELGSPVFPIVIGNIADGAFETHDLNEDNSVYAKYIPYDYVEITNLSALTLTLTLNDIHEFVIPPSVSLAKSDLPFRRFKITNNSGAGLTGTDVKVSVQHQPLTQDKLVRRPKSLMDNIRSALPFVGFMR